MCLCPYRFCQPDSVDGNWRSNSQRVSWHALCMLYVCITRDGRDIPFGTQEMLVKHSLPLPSSRLTSTPENRRPDSIINHKLADSPSSRSGYGLDFKAYINNNYSVPLAENCISFPDAGQKTGKSYRAMWYISLELFSVVAFCFFLNKAKIRREPLRSFRFAWWEKTLSSVADKLQADESSSWLRTQSRNFYPSYPLSHAALLSTTTSLNWKFKQRLKLVMSLGGTLWSEASKIESVTDFVGSTNICLPYSIPINFMWMQASSCESGLLCCSAGGATCFKFTNYKGSCATQWK